MFQLVSTAKIDPVKKLLRKAAAKKKSGEVEDAIETLYEAYREISRSSVNYTLGPFLRLPLYLQQANRPDEAWREFNRLLIEGYPNQYRTTESISMDHAVIYDKMRLFLQREQRNQEAVKFGIFSHLLLAIALDKRSRKKQLRLHMSKNSVNAMIQELLKKARMEGSYPELLDVFNKHTNTFPKVNFPLLGREINTLLLH